VGATKSSGDANGDGAVNGADFLIWQREQGLGPMAAGAAVSAPEPSCFVLCAAGISIGARRRTLKVVRARF
jgi:hypothetical protein